MKPLLKVNIKALFAPPSHQQPRAVRTLQLDLAIPSLQWLLFLGDTSWHVLVRILSCAFAMAAGEFLLDPRAHDCVLTVTEVDEDDAARKHYRQSQAKLRGVLQPHLFVTATAPAMGQGP